MTSIETKKAWSAGSVALRALALITTSAAALAFSAPAMAQDDTSASSDEEEPAIIVTGSRIRRDAYTTTEPLTVISKSEMTQAGFNSATEALQSTQVTQGSSQINNYYAGYVVDGGTGANTLGLRGLGPARTLLLLNGHRIAPAGTRGSVGSVDTNVLPTALIDRIEILKAGASSIYGSDAVAGVVNIITDTKLEGLVVEGQVTIPEAGRGIDRRFSASFGYNGDRFHFLGSAEYYKRDRLSRRDVDFTKCPIGGYLSGVGTELGSGDYVDPATGKPACFTLDNGGVTINTLGVSTRSAHDRLTGAVGSYNRLVPDSSIMSGPTPGYAGVDYYSRDTLDPQQEYEELVTPAEIYTGFMQASYDFDFLGNAQAYAEVLVNQRQSSNLLYRQLSLDYWVDLVGDDVNPLVPAQFQDSAIGNPNETTNGYYLGVRAFIGYGNTENTQQVDFARISGGLRGDFFFPGWRYDFYASKAWSDGDYTTETFLTDRIARSLLAVDNGDGTFSCADMSDANCVAAPPVNADTIGGRLPQDYRDYITQKVTGTTKFREATASFNIDGPLFMAPGGEAKLALGAEVRDSSIDDTPPADSISGNLYNLTSATPTRGSDRVWETFGEIYLPVLSHVPGAYMLNLDASARWTHYDSYGGQGTYKVAGEWEPIRGIGLRASYGTSYRAPALFEQFLGATSGFLSSSTDPCDDYANSSNPIVQANCAAIGLPADFEQHSGVIVLNAGGAASGLKAETSTNFSVGAVLQPVLPTSVGSFSFAVDYFSIEVKNGVSRVGAGSILNLCYGDTNFQPNQGFCRLVSRDANDILTVNNNYINLSTDKVRGLEFNLRYSRDVGPGTFTLDALLTKYLEQASKLFPDDPLEDANGTITQPDWTGSFNARYRVGKFTFRYGLDWVKGDHHKTYEYLSLNPDGTVDTDYVDFLKDNYYFEVNDYFTHSFSVQANIDNFELTAGVRNLFNASLPRISADAFNLVGNTPLYSGYDYVGRRFFLNATAKF